MPEKHLHLISFSIPFPANYGGVIDVFYKLKALHKAGIKIHLHCFQYDREVATELEKYCESVNYYPRKTGFKTQFSLKPYIVNSRQSKLLLNTLLQDKYPILFEGLHSCYYLSSKVLKNRILIYRESNIEHHYYYNLSKAEDKLFRKIYFLFESARLYFYQKQLSHASKMLVVSQTDCSYLKKQFPSNEVVYLPSFHGNEEVSIKSGKSDYVLYHGNLSVSENSQAALFLIREVFATIKEKLVIAGLNPSEELRKEIQKHVHIDLIANPTSQHMNDLIANAQINILITFQPTGLKLKLLNTIYKGRYILVNTHMLAGTGLEQLCIIKDTAEEMQNAIKTYINRDFDIMQWQQRSEILQNRYSDTRNASQLIHEVFGD